MTQKYSQFQKLAFTTLVFMFVMLGSVIWWKQSSTSTLQLMRDSCSMACLRQLKEVQMCEKFCEFVDHLAEKHDEELKKISPFLSEQILRYSMDDICQFRRISPGASIHEIGAHFTERVRYYEKELWRSTRTEL